MNKSIFFDVDNTLVCREKNMISKSTIQAIKSLKKKNINIAIATGRSLAMVKQESFYDLFKTIISANGSLITVNDEVIYKEYMNQRLVRDLLTVFEKNQTPYCIHFLHESKGKLNQAWVAEFSIKYNMPLGYLEEDILNGYELGADDYVTKPFSLSVLLLKIDAYCKRNIKSAQKKEIISGDICIYQDEMKIKVKEEIISLTKNEWKMLTLFLAHPKQILSKNQILENVTMSVPSKSIYGLVGENGAGKTTLFRILAGLSKPSSGTFSIMQSVSLQELSEARRRIGFMIEMPALYPDMTVLQNIFVQQIQYNGHKDASKAISVLQIVGLDTQQNKKARHLSLGMKQRLALAIALLNDPEILILDEPINGLDPMGIVEIRELLLSLNQTNGITIVISSHILSELEHIATHYGFLHNGKLLREVSSSSIPQSSDGLEGFYKDMLEGGK